MFLFMYLKGQFKQKWNFCHHLITLMSKIILKNAGNQTVMVPIDFYFFPYDGIQWWTNCLVLQHTLFCVQHNKETYTGLECCEGE